MARYKIVDLATGNTVSTTDQNGTPPPGCALVDVLADTLQQITALEAPTGAPRALREALVELGVKGKLAQVDAQIVALRAGLPK